MIRITVNRDEEGRIAGIRVRGHADYGEYGQDIVCAAVSGITIGLTNASESLLGVRLFREEDNTDGELDLRVPAGLSSETDGRVRFLLEAMQSSLRSIADEYKDYVQMDEHS
ncbi:ribosomal-processing cysteine protease Prp [Paludifilum halophilum]|uniref:Ribosomal processing cysteine protease Prp n=1 Tax=Paludifilum halophilum TaxID=1642702 RepID=A0A235B7H5_9BACL|nr:ribosomal-processing cysteine protease Prp [Paludifilum halophilum]OYD08246.1 hypothetical protein CHM34_05175 [Paludifilum halophilum]